MNVHVSDNAERIIRSHVRSGKCSSESEAIDAALGSLEQRAQEAPAKKAITEEDFKRQLAECGLMVDLPIPLEPAARRDFEPIKLEGEPIFATIIRERR